MEGSGGGGGGMAGGDRLSDLPDSLLHCILSRLGSRQVVQTCVLSRQWRHLWRAAWTIDLDDREFLSTAAPADDTGDVVVALYHHQQTQKKENVSDRFEDLADNLLFHRAAAASSSSASPPPPDTFRLCIGDQTTHARQTNQARWVRRGLLCSPAALDFRYRDGGSFVIDLAAAAPGCPRLTRMRLDNVILEKSFMEQLDALFPALEELHLNGCSFSSVVQIASATVQHHAVDRCRKRFDVQHVVNIVAPRLATLRLAIPFCRSTNVPRHCGPTFTGYSLRGAPPPSLAGASVHVADAGRYLDVRPLHGLILDPKFVRNMALLDSLRQLLLSLSGATFLELSGLRSVVVEKKGCAADAPLAERFVSVPMLQVMLDDGPVFGSLQTLVLRDCDLGDDLRTLRRFLQKTPLLETLRLQHCKFPDALQRKKGGKRKRNRARSVTDERFQPRNRSVKDLFGKEGDVELFWDMKVSAIRIRFGSGPSQSEQQCQLRPDFIPERTKLPRTGLIPGCSGRTEWGLKLVEIRYKDDEDLAKMAGDELEEHAHRLYEVLQELRTIVHATKVQ